MRLITSVSSLKQHLSLQGSKDIGFVPTMGALHEGHLSLIVRSKNDCSLTVVSIFVNPTQFNDPKDLKNYPRDIDSDLLLLKGILSENDIVFIPEYEDLYSYEKEFSLDLQGLDRVMEGKHRPGHFEGVVRVVKLFFEIIDPARAYFGQKDFQQLTIVREMAKSLSMNTEVIGCPILRENNGLAMSSRNERLSPEIRQKASIIYSTLQNNSEISQPGEIDLVEQKIVNRINSYEDFRVEYFDIVDSESLIKLNSASELKSDRQYFGCIAVFAGEIRLIDNIEFSFLFLKG